MTARTSPRIVLLSHAGTDLTALARARTLLPGDFVDVDAVNLQSVDSAERMDALLATTLREARVIVVRLLGRASDVPGFDALRKAASTRRQALIVVSGTGEPDPELAALCS